MKDVVSALITVIAIIVVIIAVPLLLLEILPYPFNGIVPLMWLICTFIPISNSNDIAEKESDTRNENGE